MNERNDLTLQEQDTMTVANTDPILKSICDRLERLDTERRDAADAIKDEFAESPLGVAALRAVG